MVRVPSGSMLPLKTDTLIPLLGAIPTCLSARITDGSFVRRIEGPTGFLQTQGLLPARMKVFRIYAELAMCFMRLRAMGYFVRPTTDRNGYRSPQDCRIQ